MPIVLSGRESERDMEVVVSGPGGANRLFIYTGIAIFEFKGDGRAWKHDYIEFEIGRVFARGQVRAIVPMAHLNSIRNDKTAVNAGWAVDRVSAWWDDREHRIKLRADLAVRDVDGFVLRMGWTVYVLAQI